MNFMFQMMDMILPASEQEEVYERMLTHPNLKLAFFVTKLPDFHKKLPQALSALLICASGVGSVLTKRYI